jgi:hypothetical protein
MKPASIRSDLLHADVVIAGPHVPGDRFQMALGVRAARHLLGDRGLCHQLGHRLEVRRQR